MKCDELEPLRGPYLDSELEPGITLAVQQHLAACPDCARAFAEQEKLEARITAGLKQGQRTPALWQKVEQAVITGALNASRPRLSTPHGQPAGWHAALSTLCGRLQGGLRAGPRAWAGLAAVWALILTLNFAAPEADAPFVAGPKAPSHSEIRLALAQKQLWLTELAPPSEAVPAAKPKAASPGPRSDRRSQLLNS
ncbi:MAG TPA: zf-HC2 domain-containing protein [Dongiaceae bacterium]|nr:zf-HC2 domain-containing protein [Dongiaceae bacterium]